MITCIQKTYWFSFSKFYECTEFNLTANVRLHIHFGPIMGIISNMTVTVGSHKSTVSWFMVYDLGHLSYCDIKYEYNDDIISPAMT